MEAACVAAGFGRAGDESRIHALLASEGLRRGFDASGELATWQKGAKDGQLALDGETAPEVEDLVGRLNEIAGVRTLSSTFDLSGDDDLALTLRGDLDVLERRAREGLARDPAGASWLEVLVEILVDRGALNEATEKAQTLTVVRDDAKSWQTLGRVHLRARRPADCGRGVRARHRNWTRSRERR